MKATFFIGFLAVLLIHHPAAAASTYPVGAILDLRDINLEKEQIFTLDGKWSFHWQSFIDPVKGPDADQKGMIVSIPSYWDDYTLDGRHLSKMGYGSYRLMILLPEGFRSALLFEIPVFDAAYRFYLNGEEVCSNGIPGRSRIEEIPNYEPISYTHFPRSDTLDLLFHVSNFHHRRGGFWQVMKMGHPDLLNKPRTRQNIYTATTAGVLFFFTLFFLFFSIFSRSDRFMLWFALASFGMLIRMSNTGLFLSSVFFNPSWSMIIRMEYIGTYLAYGFGMLFLDSLFPRKYMHIPIRINTLLSSLLLLSVIILPVRYFSYGMLIFQPLAILLILHYLLLSLGGILKARFIESIFFISLSLFIASLINDILLANSVGGLGGSYTIQIAFQFFLLSMAVIIIYRWVLKNRELQHLEESLRFKNTVLSVIAHDLKNPIASVAQFAELLAIKPELSGKKEIITSLEESAQAALEQLDNLLYWGRSQSDELKTKPELTDLSALILKVGALYAHMISQKKINLRQETDEELLVWADPVLISIVMRNLLSNAIKFTSKGGMITIEGHKAGDYVRVNISDTGRGMNTEQIRLFNEGGQLKSTSGTNHESGTGLGLQLSRNLVEMSEGTIKVESEAGKGSTFTILIPTHNLANEY